MQQPVSNIKALNLLHFSLLIGQFVFAAIAWYLSYSGTMKSMATGENIKYIVMGVSALGLLMVILSFSLYKKKIEDLRNSGIATKDKLMSYRAANLIRWAMLEAPVLLAIIAFMLTGHFNFLLLAAAILILFISTKPTASKTAAELGISEEEINN
jgi:hypothetical protein